MKTFYEWWNKEGRGMQRQAFDTNHAKPGYFEVANQAWNAALDSSEKPTNNTVEHGQADRCEDCNSNEILGNIYCGNCGYCFTPAG